MFKLLFILCIYVFSCFAFAKGVSFQKPEIFVFGESVSVVTKKLKPQCVEMELIDVKPITAPLAKKFQTQINCSGFFYAGKPRNIELVFQDDYLDIIWILFPESDKTLIEKGFQSEFGNPDLIVEFGKIYLSANSAIRSNPSEVLFASPRQAIAMIKKLKQSNEEQF